MAKKTKRQKTTAFGVGDAVERPAALAAVKATKGITNPRMEQEIENLRDILNQYSLDVRLVCSILPDSDIAERLSADDPLEVIKLSAATAITGSTSCCRADAPEPEPRVSKFSGLFKKRNN